MPDLDFLLEVIPHGNLHLLPHIFVPVLTRLSPATDHRDGRVRGVDLEVPQHAVKVISILTILRIPEDDVDRVWQLEDAVEREKLGGAVELEQRAAELGALDDGVDALQDVEVMGKSNQNNL